jgi:hypothetical protein
MAKVYSVKCDDKKINGLALGICTGQANAGEEFAEEITPLLKDYSHRIYCVETGEDKLQSFLMVAWEIALEYQERYLGQNIMPIIYQSCKNWAINKNKEQNDTQKRGKNHITKSMNETVGGDGSNKEREYADLVGDYYQQPEDLAIGQVAGCELMALLHCYIEKNAGTKNGHIIQTKLEGKSNIEIARDLNDLFEKDPVPFDEVEYNGKHSKSVSRAIKDFKEFLDQNNYSLAGMLETKPKKKKAKKKVAVKN